MLAPSCATGPRRRPLCAAVVILSAAVVAGCEPPPDNGARFWQGQEVSLPAGDAGVPPPASDDSGIGPILSGRGGSGSGAVGGAGGSGGGTGGRGGADAGAISDGAVASGTACTMTVKLATVTTGLDYAPRNIGAVWIADAGGKFVKSLEVWANRRMSHLNRWGDATSAAGRFRDTVDAVTAATASKHLTHASIWNCTAADGKPVPRGMYQVCMEMNESNDLSVAYQCVKFDNAGVAWKAQPSDANFFKGRVIDYAPR